MSDGYTAERLAELTGTPVERLAVLEGFGLLRRSDTGTYPADSVERLALARHALDRGVPADELRPFCPEQADVPESLRAGRRTDGRALTVDELLAQLPPGALDDDFVKGLLN